MTERPRIVGKVADVNTNRFDFGCVVGKYPIDTLYVWFNNNEMFNEISTFRKIFNEIHFQRNQSLDYRRRQSEL